MADDHAAAAIGAYGSHLARINPTPNLDRFASEGILFTNCFATNSICTPSRACILTGQYSQTNGVRDLEDSLDGSRHFLPMEMSKLGYETAIIGKWHLKTEPNFDYYKVFPGQGRYFDPVMIEKGGKPWPQNKTVYPGHSTDVITDQTISWLASRNKSKPFFLMHHYKAPHDEFDYSPRYEQYLQAVDIPEPVSLYFRDLWGSVATRGSADSLVNEIGSSISSRNWYRNYVEQYAIGPRASHNIATHLAYQEYLKRYLRCVKGIDDNLKKLFNYLKKNDLWDNTIIIYTSDQGMMLGAHDFMDKRLDVPAHFGIRTADYKLIFFNGRHYKESMMGQKSISWQEKSGLIRQTPVACEFYDLKRDPQELVNRYSDPEYAEIIAGLKQELIRQRAELNETDQKYPEIEKIISENWNKQH
jgi:uncharacterized sulfatase